MSKREERLLELYLDKYVTTKQYYKMRERVKNSTKEREKLNKEKKEEDLSL